SGEYLVDFFFMAPFSQILEPPRFPGRFIAIKDLIDAGEPHLSNAEKLASSIKLDFSILRAVHGKAITVGELVAHIVPISRLDHIEGALSSLVGKSFLQALRTTTDRWAHEIRGEANTPILSKPDEVFADVVRTFELRHIICHEIASAYEIDSNEVARCFESCVAFLRVADEFISETIHPGAPLSQAEMNIAAFESLAEKKKLLEDAVATIKLRLDSTELAAFEIAHENWQSYCDAWANFVAGDQANGGTIWPMIYSGTAETLVQHRFEEVSGCGRLGDGG
ncbi:lysozyme inhibitor LprI family protein, partial [Noviherbaspirillum autotrophicum]